MPEAKPLVVVSNALPKSASTLLSVYTVGLVEAALGSGGQAVLRRGTASGRIGGSADFVRRLDRRTTDVLLEIGRAHGPAVAKCHSPLTPALRRLILAGEAAATYIHRDPRDVILSAMDHHRAWPRERGFWTFTSVESAIPRVQAWCRTAQPWLGSGLAFVTRYVDLLADPRRVLAAAACHLGLDVDPCAINGIVKREAESRRPGAGNLNTGRPTRFRSEMSAADLALATERLHDEITGLGYTP